MAATMMSAIATQPLRNQLNWYAVTNESSHGRIPYDGWKTNSQMMPAMAGAMPYGHNRDRKSTRLNSSHGYISYAVFCLKKKKLIGTQCRMVIVAHRTLPVGRMPGQ